MPMFSWSLTFPTPFSMKFSALINLLAAALAASLAAAPTAHATSMTNTLFVDFASTDSAPQRGTTKAFSTFGAAIAAAHPGDTVQLMPGYYKIAQGGVKIATDGLTIIGYGAHLIADDYVPANAPNRLWIAANDITINGLIVDGSPRPGLGLDGPGLNVGIRLIYVTGQRAHLKNVNIGNCTSIGLFIQGDAQDCVIDDLVSNQCFTHIFVQELGGYWPTGLKIHNPSLHHGFGAAGLSGGIKLQNYGPAVDSRCEIVNASIESTGEMGIEAQGAFTGIAVRSCKIYDTTTGISCAAPQMLVDGCQIKGFRFAGIEVAESQSDRCTIQNNEVDGTLRDGTPASTSGNGFSISAGADHVVVRGGTVRDVACMVNICGAGDVLFHGVQFRPAAGGYSFAAQGVNCLTYEGCRVEAPADGGAVLKVWFWQSQATDPAQAPTLRIVDTTVLARASENVLILYTTVAGAKTNLIVERLNTLAQGFCGGGFIAGQGDISTVNCVFSGCLPEGTGQFGWTNDAPAAEKIGGNTLTLGDSGSGGRVIGSSVPGGGGSLRLQSINNEVAADALVVQNDPGGTHVHMMVPLNLDGGVSGSLPIIARGRPPGTPASGVVVLWVNRADNKLHAKDATGADHVLW